MNQNTSSTRDDTTALTRSFERYLQDKGKGRGGDGGNYRRNAARELERFAEWTAGARGDDDWIGIVPDDVDREPTFEDLDERVFREYARHLAGDRGLKQNTVQTYYRYISAWCGWCVNEGYLEAHFAQRASAMAPLPKDDGRKPGDQQAWTSDALFCRLVTTVLDALTVIFRQINPEMDAVWRYGIAQTACLDVSRSCQTAC